MSVRTQPLLIAHRGASFECAENTLAAFELAWRQGADGIETDVRLTADGVIVCIHDEDTRRVCGDSQVGLNAFAVEESRYDELSSLDVGSWKGACWAQASIPTLEMALGSVPQNKYAFIELKTGPEIVCPLVAVLNRSSLRSDRFVLISFDEATLSACARELPHVRRHLLVEYQQDAGGRWRPTADEVAAGVRRVHADGLGTQNKMACFNEEFVGQLRAAGIREFQVWTVDDPHEAAYYERLGAWAITTNRPGYLISALGKHRNRQE